jgi:hypothetical protein
MTTELSQHEAVVNSEVKCLPMHGDLSQRNRELNLQAFRDGKARCLVATDVAARGLDIPQCDLVVHYSIPDDTDAFVHRTGRTGRAGRSGQNILLIDNSQLREVANLEKFVGRRFTRRAVPGTLELMQKRNVELMNSVNAVQAKEAEPYLPAAEAFLAEKLGEEAAGALDVATRKIVVEALASSFQVASGLNSVTDFSALDGEHNRVTIAFPRHRLKVNTALRGLSASQAYGLRNDALSEILRVLRKQPQSTQQALKQLLARRDVIGSVTLAADGSMAFVDVHPKIAQAVVQPLAVQDDEGADQQEQESFVPPFTYIKGNFPDLLPTSKWIDPERAERRERFGGGANYGYQGRRGGEHSSGFSNKYHGGDQRGGRGGRDYGKRGGGGEKNAYGRVQYGQSGRGGGTGRDYGRKEGRAPYGGGGKPSGRKHRDGDFW